MKDGEEDVFKQMDVIASEMEHLFYHLFSPKHPVKSVCQHYWSPLCDVYETADKLIIKMELTGVKRDDVGIALEEDRLVVRGVRHGCAPAEIVAYHQMEINYGPFERSIHLRHGVRQESITAHFEDGFLTISIEKRPPGDSESSLDIEVE
jgi:HSP20 family protein